MRWLAETGRRLRGGFTITYLGVLATAPMADATIEAMSLETVSHVESQREELCYTGHDEVMCQLCRLIEVPGHTMARGHLGVDTRVHHRVTRPPLADLATGTFLTSSPARAPPHV